jgi:hypothetical protein
MSTVRGELKNYRLTSMGPSWMGQEALSHKSSTCNKPAMWEGDGWGCQGLKIERAMWEGDGRGCQGLKIES